jgi:hypothetical protein
MSDLYLTSISCPRCHEDQRATLFRSVNADFIEAQVQTILDGSFEHTTCARCGHAFRPEHPMLYVHYTARTWIVMHPLADRRRFAALEPAVVAAVERQFAAAPPAVAANLRGVRPRLVFGQHMLSEAVRVARAGLDPALLECAKLFTVRRQLALLMPLGPFELCFERYDDAGALACTVHALATGERTGEIALAADVLAEVRAVQPDLEQMYPDLFAKPYVSASRYLFGDLA